jgi:rRNA maturation RNase YbeY
MITFSGDTSCVTGRQRAIKNTIQMLANDFGYDINRVDYVFCDDEYLLEINKQSLNHDYYTDIITFDYNEGYSIESEIYISLDRVKENAKTFDQTFHEELSRVILHGALHLVGFKDKTKKEKEKMRAMEAKYLETLNEVSTWNKSKK